MAQQRKKTASLKPTSSKTMVCVTGQRTCERLIHEGAKLAGAGGLSVVHVARTGSTFLGEATDGGALEYLYRVSRTYGADMDVLRADDVIGTLVSYARENQVDLIVIGAARDENEQRFAKALQTKLPKVTVHVVMP